jgi:predicted nucleic acid-binding Zn ribbon protein
VSRRRLPRPAAEGLRAARGRAAPLTPLAAVQSAWGETVGGQISAISEPVGERAGTVTVACEDAVWAGELDLLQDELLARLRARLGDLAPRGLRFEVKGLRRT